MRILVTGASGHVGGNLERALLARGDDVRVMVHGRPEYGTALTNAEGRFEMPVNGGNSVKICNPEPDFGGGRGAFWTKP
mgnify:CR=1 FL=1